MSAPLDQHQITSFRDQGFLVADFGLPAELLERVKAEVAPLYDGAHTAADDGYLKRSVRVQDAWRTCAAVKQLALWPATLQALQQLFGRLPKPFQTLNFPYGTGQPLHSDTIHFNSHPPGFMCGAWVALEDIGEGQGPLVYVPGSHKWPEVTMVDVGVPGTVENYPAYEQHVRRIAEASGARPAFGIVPKGSTILWHANLLHGGANHNDPSRTRHSQVTHYFFEGCWYYTPMLTDYHVRKPQWIE